MHLCKDPIQRFNKKIRQKWKDKNLLCNWEDSGVKNRGKFEEWNGTDLMQTLPVSVKISSTKERNENPFKYSTLHEIEEH